MGGWDDQMEMTKGRRQLGAAVVLITLVAVLLIVAGSTAVGATDGDAWGDGQNEMPVDDPTVDNATADTDSAEQRGYVDVSLSGDAHFQEQYDIVEDHPGRPFVWKSENLTIDARVTPTVEASNVELCGQLHDDEGEVVGELPCESFTIGERPVEVTYNMSSWPENSTGQHAIVFELHSIEPNSGDEPIDRHESNVYVLEKDGDLTGDGLSNEREVQIGTDFTTPDSSGNGLTDWQEVEHYGTDPLRLDTTGDGINDATIIRLGLDPTEPYVVHKYAGGILGVVFLTAGVMFFLVRRWIDTSVSLATSNAASSASRDDTTASEQGNTATASEQGNTVPSPDGPSEPDPSLLTNDEYVCQLLANYGGRMKQQSIIDETGWSKAKVSRVLSDLEERGQVERLRVGRENVVDLVEHQERDSEQDPEQNSMNDNTVV